MEIQTQNIDELLISMIALTGQLPKDIKLDGITSAHVNNRISSMKHDRLITVNRNRKIIRIRNPNGIEFLMKFNNELYEHYKLMSNNHSFKSGEMELQRYEDISKCSIAMINNGALIDNIKLSLNSNRFGRNKVYDDDLLISALGNSNIFKYENKLFDTEIDSLVSSLPDKGKYFYSGKIIKGDTSQGYIKQISPSKFTGIYLSSGNSYVTYYISNLNSNCLFNSEKGVSEWLMRLHEKAFGLDSMHTQLKKVPNGQAIVWITNSDLIYPMMKPKKKDRYFMPARIYDDYYFLPDNEYGYFVLQMLSTNDWERKLNQILFKDKTSDFSDGVLNGVPSWEFISCNFSKIQKIKNYKQREFNVVCTEWQEPIITKLLTGYKANMIVLRSEQIEQFKKHFYHADAA